MLGLPNAISGIVFDVMSGVKKLTVFRQACNHLPNVGKKVFNYGQTLKNSCFINNDRYITQLQLIAIM